MSSVTSSCSTEDKEWLRGRPLRDKDSRRRRVKLKEKGFLHPRVRGLMRNPLALRAQGTWVHTSPNTAPIQSRGQAWFFLYRHKEKRREVKERNSWKVSMLKGSYEISSTEFLFNIFNLLKKEPT